MPPPTPIILKLQHKLLPISHVFNLGLHCPSCWEAKKKGKNPFNDNPGQWIKIK